MMMFSCGKGPLIIQKIRIVGLAFKMTCGHERSPSNFHQYLGDLDDVPLAAGGAPSDQQPFCPSPPGLSHSVMGPGESSAYFSQRRHSTPATLIWLDQHYHLSKGVCLPRSEKLQHQHLPKLQAVGLAHKPPSRRGGMKNKTKKNSQKHPFSLEILSTSTMSTFAPKTA